MQLKNLKVEELEIEVREEAVEKQRSLVLVWSGSIHAADPAEYLDQYFDLLLEDLESDALSLVCDFSNLDYMNSASIPPLIHLLRECADREIKCEFRYDSSRKVQTASFRALDVIAKKSKFTNVRGV